MDLEDNLNNDETRRNLKDKIEQILKICDFTFMDEQMYGLYVI